MIIWILLMKHKLKMTNANFLWFSSSFEVFYISSNVNSSGRRQDDGFGYDDDAVHGGVMMMHVLVTQYN